MTGASVNILIGGEAGQGLATIGTLLANALTRSGYHILVTQDYMSRIRGGHNTFAIRMDSEPVLGPRESVDVLVALDQPSIDLHREALSERGVIVAGREMNVHGHARTFGVPYEELAPKKIFYNTVALGVLASVVCLDMSILEDLLADTFEKKGQEIVRQNVDVLRAAYEWKSRQEKIFECPMPPEVRAGLLTMDGNEAIALGALAAGANFCSFYPMTPSTSVPLNLIAKGQELGVVVEQAEDEIAAMNMALGASYAGARAMTATSGGGFDLMSEGLSLAGITETPIVIVLAMRPGPATGLPTRTEQGDLNLALFSGHGEFPRAILAPGSVEECFHLTHRAFGLAESWQSPVFVLTDQFLADSFRSIEPFDIDSLPEPPALLIEPPDPESYKRYALTDTGVSPRAIPTLSRALVVVDSDEHDEQGHITEDFGVRTAMVDKRNRKFLGLLKEVLPPVYEGSDKPDLLLVCWGSTMGPLLEAARTLREQGRKVATLCFNQVWPLDPSQFARRLIEAREVVMVEGNSTGQFRGILQVQSGFRIDKLVPRYDGLPFTAAYILNRLQEMR
ncbi:2-oxoacid:acceptor oxidoreductase subunit alpha [Desulfocurvibacter africanus]|uniref:2-oxoacid:acceptor oxidoreductase subunit alpha n=1 Tax=Desulfocurvibacter africanus TaxID=873 RepID=UPI00041D7FEB|nr:2-oxoacid:acceptor oxidoreductase subunit alpha [Desulfocurvibacter africanus]